MAIIKVDQELCDGCGICVKECPVSLYVIIDSEAVAESPDVCMVCQFCETACPKGAIVVTE